MNPFEIHGPAYLVFYLIVCSTVFMVAYFLRGSLLNQAAEANDRTQNVEAKDLAQTLEPYEAAYLAGGVERVFLTACGSLARHNLIEIDPVMDKVKITGSANSKVYAALDRIERALISRCSGSGQSLSSCKAAVTTATADLKRKLAMNGLIVDSSQNTTVQILPGFIYLFVALLFAVPKFIIASQTHLPYTFLVLEMATAVAASYFLFRADNSRTVKGDRVLRALSDGNSALMLTHATNPSSLSLRDCALAYGVFGALALAGDPFMAAHAGLHRAYAGSSDSGGCGSSCGSSCGGGCGGGCGG